MMVHVELETQVIYNFLDKIFVELPAQAIP